MHRILILIVVTLSTTVAFTQSNDADVPIQFQSFQDVLRFADKHAVQIQNAHIGEQIATAKKNESKSYLYPSVNAIAGYNNNLTLQPTLVPAQIFDPTAPAGTFSELTFGQQHVYSSGVQVQWNILNIQKIVASQTANILSQQSEINTQKSKFNTYNSLASIYYSILLTQEAIAIYEENVDTSEAMFNNTEAHYKKGILSEVERNTTEIKHLQNVKTLQQARHNLERLYKQLQQQLNTNQELKILDKPQNFKVTTLDIANTHPEIEWQALEVEKQKAIVKEKKGLLLPSLSLSYNYNYSWATDSFNDFANANELPQQFIGAQLKIPVFNGFSTRQKIKQSQWTLQQEQLKLENTKRTLQLEDDLLLIDIETYAAELSEAIKIWTLQQKNDVHAENKYQKGISSLNERLDTYENLLMAQNSYLQSLASYTLANYKLYIRQLNLDSNN